MLEIKEVTDKMSTADTFLHPPVGLLATEHTDTNAHDHNSAVISQALYQLL
ncbi:hypothetical protein ACF07T_21435 [Streptomyces sp. NPDC015184]|uniref:hypothetical protein n=1 Tax=Streptomyces sp. NPDC015184 TaxID=3364946 RepID=UPI0036FFCA30